MRAPDFWSEKPGIIAGLLAPFGAVWAAAAVLRRTVARPYRASVPVICVGNLVAGGSGKTPVVLSLLDLLAEQGARPHVVTRGYGGRLPGPVTVDPLRHDAAAVGDEALLIAARAPCWVARDRAAGIRSAAASGAQIVVLDDGFQNPGFAKDLAVIVVDAEYGFGNGRVIPAGPLREPVGVGLARADVVILVGAGDVPAIAASERPVLRAELAPLRIEAFRGARVVAFAGIGRPEKFFAMLRGGGAELANAWSFPDHHNFSREELGRLRRDAENAGAALVTTAKDWVRLPETERHDIAKLDVEIRWHDTAQLTELLGGVLRRRLEGPGR